jgi:hypothetical protein
MDGPTIEKEGSLADPAPLAALAFLAPWVAISLLLPTPYKWEAVALVAALGALLVTAGAWSFHRAKREERDAAHWAFLTVITFGAAMIVLLASKPAPEYGQHCLDCGRVGELDEPFCFGCGTTS